jgi:UTP--glucose-1-phosphate uridylyltransferase
VPELESALEAKGDAGRLEAVRASTGLGQVHFVRQGVPKGLGHAVLCAKSHVGQEPFAVLLGDDLIDERDTLLTTMLEVQERTGGSVVALLEVDPGQVHMYGCAAVEPVDAASVGGGDAEVVRVTGLVEKPDPADAPSNLAIIGRYVLHPAVFDVLERTGPGRGGEIQLTDALATLADMPVEDGGGVYGVVFRGRRYDTGDRLDYLKAVVRIAVDRPDLGPDLRAWLTEYVPTLR